MGDRAARVRVSGPLAVHAEGFRAMLAGRGYAPSSAAGQLQVMAHLSRWLAEQDRSAADVTPGAVEEFLLARKGAGYRRWLSRRAVAPLLEYLEAAGLAIRAAAPGPLVPGGAALAGFRDYLVTERGLAASTVRNYLDAARLLAAQDRVRLDALTAGDVTRFVVAQCRDRRTGSATVLVTGLRALLRYLHLAGFTSVSLAGAVPSAASASPLPEAIGPVQASLLLGSCDRGTAAGLRDTRCWCCWCAWACGSARSPRWSWVTSTGGAGWSPSAARAAGWISFRCPPTPGRRSRPGCAAAGRDARAGGSLPRCWPRSAR
jgi:integrase/recombinase XerD